MPSSTSIRIGSRTSPLSQAQTEEVLAPLRAAYPDTEFTLVPITTGGDRRKNAPLLSMARGMFVKEIELALLENEIDIAVHSAKDLPAQMPDGLSVVAFTRRHDPRDVLVNRWGLTLKELPEGARLGTSSPRRSALIRALRPETQVVPIRGNVGTRLDKAAGDDYDGVVLAAAGLERLGRSGEINEYFKPEEFTPEVGQGALLVEARSTDGHVAEMLGSIDHGPTRVAVTSERAFLETLGGGCKVPVAAYATLDGSELRISAMAATPDGDRVFRVETSHASEEPIAAGQAAARALMATEASEIIVGGAES